MERCTVTVTGMCTEVIPEDFPHLETMPLSAWTAGALEPPRIYSTEKNTSSLNLQIGKPSIEK